MSRRTLWFLLTPVAMVLFGAATMTAGNAEAYPPGGWPSWPICAEGTLAPSGVYSDAITVAGSIQPCAGAFPGTIEDARWGMALYHAAGGFTYALMARPFASATTPTVFEQTIWVGLEAAYWGPIQAACLITGPGTRIACVAITTDWSGALLVEQIPVDDPRASFTVTVVPGHEHDPECGACV
jgi:hypothetical protein